MIRVVITPPKELMAIKPPKIDSTVEEPEQTPLKLVYPPPSLLDRQRRAYERMMRIAYGNFTK